MGQRRWIMRRTYMALFIAGLLGFYGCDIASHENRSDTKSQPAANQSGASPSIPAQPAAEKAAGSVSAYYSGGGGSRAEQTVSLDSATSAQAATIAADRKIIRNAELTLETESPTDGQQRI